MADDYRERAELFLRDHRLCDGSDAECLAALLREAAEERDEAMSDGRGSALAQAVRKQLGPIPSIALTAAVMGVTPKTIHNWIRKGSLRTTKPAGGKVYVDAESVIDFLERGRR